MNNYIINSSNGDTYLDTEVLSPVSSYLSTLNTDHSIRTAQSNLYQLVNILQPAWLYQLEEELQEKGLHRYEVIHRFAWHRLTYVDTARLRAELVKRYVPARANLMLCMLRKVLKECWRLQLMSTEDYERAADLKPVYLPKHRSSQVIDDYYLETLFKILLQRGEIGIRDAAMLALLAMGLTRGELSRLDMSDYHPEPGAIYIHANSVRSRARERWLHLPPAVKLLIDRWLAVRTDVEGPLFPQMVRSQHLTGRVVNGFPRLTEHGIYCIIQNYAGRAGIPHFRLLDLRKTFLTKLFSLGIDSITVAHLGGIQSPAYARTYDESMEEAKRQAALQMFENPFDHGQPS
jgi:integrase